MLNTTLPRPRVQGPPLSSPLSLCPLFRRPHYCATTPSLSLSVSRLPHAHQYPFVLRFICLSSYLSLCWPLALALSRSFPLVFLSPASEHRLLLLSLADPFSLRQPPLLFALSVRTRFGPPLTRWGPSTASWSRIASPRRTDRKSDKLSRIEKKRGRKKASFTAYRTLLPIDEDVTRRDMLPWSLRHFGLHLSFLEKCGHRCGRNVTAKERARCACQQ